MPRRAQRLSSLSMEALVRECYAFHCLLTNLGFSLDDLYTQTTQVLNWDPPGLCAVVHLSTQDLSYVYVLRALVPGDDSRFLRKWLSFTHAQPRMDRTVLDRYVELSEVWRTKSDILESLAIKGFVFPSVEEKERQRNVN